VVCARAHCRAQGERNDHADGLENSFQTELRASGIHIFLDNASYHRAGIRRRKREVAQLLYCWRNLPWAWFTKFGGMHVLALCPHLDSLAPL